MKQIVILSGKGGTGKTVITAALASMTEHKVMVDCDVDAADLHLLLAPSVLEQHDFESGQKAWIDIQKCIKCGKCFSVCRFEAITKELNIDVVGCEGCGFCQRVCPVNAIEMKKNVCGQWFVSQTRFGIMVHAKLGVGQENSGKLVTHIRQKAKEIVANQKKEWVIIDGPPGIGCPVMASLSGVDAVILVTEPTCSGFHDVKRVMDLCDHFKIPTGLVMNKYDLNVEMTKEVEIFCQQRGVRILSKIPFDQDIVKAVVMQKTMMENGNEDLKKKIKEIWVNLNELINKDIILR